MSTGQYARAHTHTHLYTHTRSHTRMHTTIMYIIRPTSTPAAACGLLSLCCALLGYHLILGSYNTDISTSGTSYYNYDYCCLVSVTASWISVQIEHNFLFIQYIGTRKYIYINTYIIFIFRFCVDFSSSFSER